MSARRLLCTVFSLAALQAPDALAACNIFPDRSADRGARALITVAGKPITVTGKLQEENCDPIEVKAGRVYVVWRPARETGGVARFDPCDSTKPCTVPPDARSGVNMRTARLPAYNRMDGDQSPVPAIPTGKILNAENASRFDLDSAGITNWQLTVTEVKSKRVIYAQSGSQGAATLPAGAIQAGGKYQWQIRTSTGEYSGGFDVLTGDAAQRVRLALAAVAGTSPASAWERQLREMFVYYDNNLYFEAAQLERQLGL